METKIISPIGENKDVVEECKLTNEEIARVFAMYWGNVSFENGIGGHCILSLTDVNDIGLGRISGKLLLTPLPNISDEHAIEVAKTMPEGYGKINALSGKNWLEFWMPNLPYSLHRQLILWGYAVPIYFGVNHWANSKTAIELGIAKEKQP